MNSAELPDNTSTPDGGPQPNAGLVIRSNDEIVAVIPYLLGFHPGPLSLVMVAFHGPNGLCAARADLPRDIDPQILAEVTARFTRVVTANDFASVILVGYGSDEVIYPAVTAVACAVAMSGADVVEMLRVDGGRWWSYLCDDPQCCPPEGTAYDPASSVFAAEAASMGYVAMADRAEFAASIAPAAENDTAMQTATEDAVRRFRDWTTPDGDPITQRAKLLASAIELLQELPERAGSGSAPVTDAEIAWLGVLLTDLRIRDEAWVRIDADNPDRDLAVWREVVRRVDPRYAAAPAALLAYTAYITGDGPLANVALDRALDADPEYSMATLLRDMIIAGVPPSEARVNLTSEDLADTD